MPVRWVMAASDAYARTAHCCPFHQIVIQGDQARGAGILPQNFSQVRHLLISPEQAGQRVDNFLLRELRNVPRSHVYRLLRSGQVRVNGGRVKPTRKLQAGDDLRLPPIRDPGERHSQRVPDAGREEIRRAILHEDDQLLVLNKPAGWAVHAGSGVPYGVIDALRQIREECPFLELAHRLDRETSGCLIAAKDRATLQQLHAGFRHSQTETGHLKRYVALCTGRWTGSERLVELPLDDQRLESGERMVKVDHEQGRMARSLFRLRKQFARACLLEIDISTGRMHQIRVHAQSLGHAVLGDQKYGDRDINRQFRRQGLKRMFLHAEQVELKMGTDTRGFSAPLPAELTRLLDELDDA